MADKILTLTEAHKRQIEQSLKRLQALKREMAALQAAGVMDCSDYDGLCDFVSASLTKKYEHFFPNGRLRTAKKAGEP